jgi:hypothetical protein
MENPSRPTTTPETRSADPDHRWYWLDTGWGCGAIVTIPAGNDEELIVDSAPIFHRLRGASLETLKRKFRVFDIVYRCKNA